MNNLVTSLILATSGALIVASILTAYNGFKQSVLSRKAAAYIAALGAGIGVGLFIYFGVSNRDLFGSVCTSFIAAIVIRLAAYFWKKETA